MEEDSFKNRLLKRNIDIWIEKYRPEYLEDVVGNPFVINTLKSIIVSGNMPNLLLAVKIIFSLLMNLFCFVGLNNICFFSSEKVTIKYA